MANYAYYEGALTGTQTKNVAVDMGGGAAWGGFVINDASTSATTMGVALSYDNATSFGSTIILKNAEKITLDALGNITNVRLVCGTNANYRMLVSCNKSLVA